MAENEKFVEPVVLIRKPFEPNRELAERIRRNTEKMMKVSASYNGYAIPTIDEILYSKENRQIVQEKIRIETEKHSYQGRNADGDPITLYKITPTQEKQLRKGFAFIEDVKLNGDIFNLVNKLNETYGAILPERKEPRFVTGEESLKNPNKNYRLVQADKISKEGDLMFSLYVRYTLPEFTPRD